jgi:hypothetical protein
MLPCLLGCSCGLLLADCFVRTSFDGGLLLGVESRCPLIGGIENGV